MSNKNLKLALEKAKELLSDLSRDQNQYEKFMEEIEAIERGGEIDDYNEKEEAEWAEGDLMNDLKKDEK